MTEPKTNTRVRLLKRIYEDYGWKLFPLLLLITLLVPIRFTVWVIAVACTYIGEGSVKFLKWTEI